MSSKTFKTVDKIEIKNNNLIQSIYDEILAQDDGKNIHEKMTAYVKNRRTPLIFEAKEYNIYDEYMGITNFVKHRGGFQDNYEKGRYRVLEYIINCIIADPLEGDYYEENNTKLLKEGGELLNTEDAMQDTLVWLFVPKRLERTIDMAWNGIGKWRS
jgi:hypothetical protein